MDPRPSWVARIAAFLLPVLLLASEIYADPPSSSSPLERANHRQQQQQHHGSPPPHHHRSPSWSSSRHASGAARHYHNHHASTHARHGHEPSSLSLPVAQALRRSSDSRQLSYSSIARPMHATTAQPATNASATTSTLTAILASTTTTTTTTTTTRTFRTADGGASNSSYGSVSRHNARPMGYQRQSNLALEPSASRSVAYSSIVHPDTALRTQQQQQQMSPSLGPIYPSSGLPSTNFYHKFHSGRRICSPSTSASLLHHRSRQARLVYADPMTPGFLCCPGWTQVTPLSFGCNKPVCSLPCQNGGVCSSPGRCTCPKGYTGTTCQIDVDECAVEKPCDQMCRNLPGSYECYCRSGYELQYDRHACRKNGSDGTALEARDLIEDFGEEMTTIKTMPSSGPNTRRPILRDTENEVSNAEDSSADDEGNNNSYDDLLARLIKLEKQFATEKRQEGETNEITARIASAIESINEIRRSIQSMQLMQQELYELRNKVKLYEFETRKIQHLSNRVFDLENKLRLRCRTGLYGSAY